MAATIPRLALTACLLLLAGVPVRAADAPPCRLPRLAHADFVTQADGALLVPITINGETAYFTLNGGARSFVFDADADRLGFGSHHYERDDGLYFGTDPVTTRRTADLVIGKVRWRDFEFYPRKREKPAGSLAIGSLGMNFLASAQLDIEINTSANAINFIAPGACTQPPWALASTGSTLDEHVPALPVVLNGFSYLGVFDTGLASGAMDIVAFNSHFGKVPDGTPAFTFAFDSMTAGETAFDHPALQIVDTRNPEIDDALHRRVRALHAFDAYVPPVIRLQRPDIVWLGRSELNRMRLYLMFGSRKVFATPAAPGAAAAPVSGH